MSSETGTRIEFQTLERLIGRRSFLGGTLVAGLGVALGRLEGAAHAASRWELGRVRTATEPFRMVTLGDSIMWGQGLPESMKFRNIVSAWVETALAGRAIKQFGYAHSGAQIIADNVDTITGLPGEIPSDHPSITKQAGLAENDVMSSGAALGAVDLVLLDGGINDVGVIPILLPSNSSGKIAQLAQDVCVGRMAKLLPLVMQLYPNAAIVVTGYYPIASSESDIVALTLLVSALGTGVVADVASAFGLPGIGIAGAVLGPAVKDQMVRNCAAWKSTTDAGFAALVAAMNQKTAGPPRVAFATPTFGSQNCFAAGPDTYLFGVAVAGSSAGTDGFIGLEADGVLGRSEPSDPLQDVQWSRARACAAANRASPKCVDACMGHPNPRGARAYADATLQQIMTTLAPHLATRGLIENAVCASLRAQEATARNQLTSARQGMDALNQDLQVCLQGQGDGGRVVKPKQCGAGEIAAEKKAYAPIIAKANASLSALAQQKQQAHCWY